MKLTKAVFLNAIAGSGAAASQAVKGAIFERDRDRQFSRKGKVRVPAFGARLQGAVVHACIIAAFLALSLYAEPPKPDPVTAATLAQQAAVIRMLQVQADPVYRAALANLEAANEALAKAKAEAEPKPAEPKK